MHLCIPFWLRKVVCISCSRVQFWIVARNLCFRYNSSGDHQTRRSGQPGTVRLRGEMCCCVAERCVLHARTVSEPRFLSMQRRCNIPDHGVVFA